MGQAQPQETGPWAGPLGLIRGPSSVSDPIKDPQIIITILSSLEGL